MAIVVKRPGYAPVVLRGIVPTDAVLSETVGGYLEAVPTYTLPPGVIVYCNEDGKYLPLLPNLAIPGDIVVGTVIAAGFDHDGETRELTDDEADTVVGWLVAHSV